MGLFDRVLTIEDILPAIEMVEPHSNAEKYLVGLRKKTVEVFNGLIYNLPERLVDYSLWVQNLIAEIPEEYRDSAAFYPYSKFVKEGDEGYDDDMGEYTKLTYILVTYERPTTDEELLSFLQERVAFRKIKLANEERMLKYEESQHE